MAGGPFCGSHKKVNLSHFFGFFPKFRGNFNGRAIDMRLGIRYSEREVISRELSRDCPRRPSKNRNLKAK